MNEIKNFCEKHGITEEQFFGKEVIERGLDLSSLTEIPKGFNPTVGGSLNLYLLTEIPDGFNPTVGGSLFLGSLKQIPNGFNPTVGGSLFLGSLKQIPNGFNPTVGGSLNLYSLTEIPDGFNPTVGEYLDLSSLTEIPKGFNPTVGGHLFLSSVKVLPKGFNPTVGGYLDLSSLTEIPEGFNPIVGVGLYLDPLKVLPQGFNVSDYENKKIPLIEWNKYIKCDNRFSEIISKKGNVWELKDIGKDFTYYLVTDGNGNYAHGDTIKQAKDDLIFKISNRDVSQYQNIDLDKKFSFTECITMYRCITGSCSTGVKNFVESNNIKKQSYSVNEIITLTKNNYGNKTFNSFFK